METFHRSMLLATVSLALLGTVDFPTDKFQGRWTPHKKYRGNSRMRPPRRKSSGAKKKGRFYNGHSSRYYGQSAAQMNRGQSCARF